MATAEDVLNKARSQLGVCEQPKGSNSGTPYHAWYPMQNAQWCAIFVSWVLWHTDPNVFYRVKSAYSGTFLEVGRAHGREVGIQNIAPGDIVIWDKPIGDITDHIGFVESVTASTFTTLEGNSGDCVRRNKDRPRVQTPTCHYYFVRPNYSKEIEMSQSAVQANIRLGTTWKTVNLGGKRSGKVYVNIINNGSELAHAKVVVQMSPSGIYGERVIDIPVAKSNVPGFVNFEVGEKFKNANMGDFSIEFSADQPITVKVTQEMM